MEDPAVRLKNTVLKHVSTTPDAYFKSQQKGEPDLTFPEKWKIAEELFDKNKPTFLLRYGKYLSGEHLELFADSEDYEVRYYVDQRKNELQKLSKNVNIILRNRRLEALKRLSDVGDYFTDKEMKRRNPLLFEELVGQFLTNDEKYQFETSGGGEPTTFAAFFMDLVDKGYAETKLMEQVEKDDTLMTDDGDSGSGRVALWGEMSSSSGSKQRVLDNSRPSKVTSEEKQLMLDEFRSKVFSDFLRGKDDEFDYSQVDENNDYDDLNTMERDQQEEYFNSESPKSVTDGD